MLKRKQSLNNVIFLTQSSLIVADFGCHVWDIRIIRPRLRLPLCILMEHKRSRLVFSEVHAVRSLVVSVVLYLQLFVFLSVFFWPMYCLPFFAFFNFQTFLCLREINLSFNKGRSPFTCRLYEFSSYVSIHSQISFHRKSYK